MNFQQVLEAAQQLPVSERRRLLEELSTLVQVRMIQPDSSPKAVRRGQQMAEEVRNELKGSMTGSLEETISNLRGHLW